MSYLDSTIEYFNYNFDTYKFIIIAENNEISRLWINEKSSESFISVLYQLLTY